MFPIGSPMCTAFSTLQFMNAQVRDPNVVHREYLQAMIHLRFVCELYAMQLEQGRYFVHEHPAGATSWGEACIQAVLNNEGVETVVMEQCQYGLEAEDGSPIRKSTKWMTNSPRIREMLSRRCLGKDGRCSRKLGGHHRAVSGRATCRRAQEYSFELCRAILMGCRRQLIDDGRLVVGVIGIQRPEEGLSDKQLINIAYLHLDVDVDILAGAVDDKGFVDSLTGQPLNREMVLAARRTELEYFAAKRVWHKVPRSKALQMQGKAPITVKWIDVNKGDDDNPNYRSRRVAREVRKPWEASIFAPTPPLEALKTIMSLAATEIKGVVSHDRRPQSERRTQISIVDISRAYFNAKVDPEHPAFVELPNEDPDKSKGMCGQLDYHMYGTRPAGKGWHTEYSSYLVEHMGFSMGDASACVFRHLERGLWTSVYGDDFTTTGSKTDLDWFVEQLKQRYELTESARLGPGSQDDKEGRVLNRTLRWTAAGLEYEADPRQVEKLVRDLGLTGANPVGTPGAKASREEAEQDKPLAPDRHTGFRAVAARSNYLSADRPECQFAAKEICRWMSAPTQLGATALKRIGRFLEGRRRLVLKYP